MFEFLKSLFKKKNNTSDSIAADRLSSHADSSPDIHVMNHNISNEPENNQPDKKKDFISTQAAVPRQVVPNLSLEEEKLPSNRENTVQNVIEPLNTYQDNPNPESELYRSNTEISRPHRHVESVAQRRTRSKSSVYIGLDFGTTFTKAAYEIAPSNVHTVYSVKFGNNGTASDYYLPSILYYNADKHELSISDDTGLCEKIEYFKYTIISDDLKKNESINSAQNITQTQKELLCCVFFLSHAISLIRDAIFSRFGDRIINSDTEWYINMGVPLEAHRHNAQAALYKKALDMAYLFERENHGINSVTLSYMDAFFTQNREVNNVRTNILPEIYAEVLLYQQHLNIPAGFYTVVDIGGGTEDIATFLKTSNSFGDKVECLAQNVIGYGFEAVAEKIAQSDDEKSIRQAKSFLMRNDVDYNNDDMIKEATPGILKYDSLIEARLKCRTLFGSCVQRARRTKVDILHRTVESQLPMYYFVMGGAHSVAFYRASINYMIKAQSNAGMPYFKEANIYDYVQHNTRLEIRDDQRLIISQMLAQPYERIPEIENMPWDLREADIVSEGSSWVDIRALQEELYPD